MVHDSSNSTAPDTSLSSTTNHNQLVDSSPVLVNARQVLHGTDSTIGHRSIIHLNNDVVGAVLEHLLASEGSFGNMERVLTLNKTISYNVLPTFYRELVIMNPGSLTAVLKALRQRPILIPHIITLQVVLEVPSPFVMFLPTIRQSQAVSFADIIPSEYRGELEALISMVTRTIRTLVLVDGIFTQILRAPMELRAFTSLTELAAPLHFLWTPQSPFMRRASNTPDHALVDSVWPNISTVWAWITELPNTMEDDMKLDLRHLRTLHRLALVFHLLDNQSVLLYLRRLKVVPTITCVSVEIAQLSPMFPVRDIVRRSYFFDPRVVFIWQGQPDPVQVRAIVEHAGGRAPAIYDLILAVPVRQRLGWPIVIQKVKERRAFGEANAWVYPADLPTLVQLDAGPFCTVPFHPPEHWLVLWSQIIG